MEDLLNYCRTTSDRVRSESQELNFKEINQRQRLDDFEQAYREFEESVTQGYDRRFREAADRGQKFFTLLKYKNSNQPYYGSARKFSAQTIIYGITDNREESGLTRLRNFFNGFNVSFRNNKETGYSTLTVSPFFPKKRTTEDAQ
tara:strand:- start:130 stop:564 length:435 start_codon:yes stop_codon:yes gene_type:complete